MQTPSTTDVEKSHHTVLWCEDGHLQNDTTPVQGCKRGAPTQWLRGPRPAAHAPLGLYILVCLRNP